MWWELYNTIHYSSCITRNMPLTNQYYTGARIWAYNILAVQREMRERIALCT